MRKNKKFIDPRYFMDEKTELEVVTTEGDRGYVQDYDEIEAEEYEQFQVDQAAQGEARPTNLGEDLREFARWVREVDGHIERLSGQHMTAAEVPSDVNLYDLWYLGTPSADAAQDLISGDY